MKLVAFTDHHGSVEATANVVRLAEGEKADLIVCAGDFSEFGHHWEKSWMILAKSWVPLFFIGGNHEDKHVTRQAEVIHPKAKWIGWWATPKVETFIVWEEHEKVQFAGIDGAHDLDPHYGDDTDLFPTYEKILRDALDPALPLVIVTHYPPSGTKCSGSQYDDSGAILVPVAENLYAVGSPLVRKIIETFNPVLVLTGHFHNRFGNEDRIGPTRILNPGPTGKLIEVQ